MSTVLPQPNGAEPTRNHLRIIREGRRNAHLCVNIAVYARTHTQDRRPQPCMCNSSSHPLTSMCKQRAHACVVRVFHQLCQGRSVFTLCRCCCSNVTTCWTDLGVERQRGLGWDLSAPKVALISQQINTPEQRENQSFSSALLT